MGTSKMKLWKTAFLLGNVLGQEADDSALNTTEGERAGDHNHDGEKEYFDPHAEFDVSPTWIADLIEQKSWRKGKSCKKQCTDLQKKNKNSHFSSIFCYSAEDLGWTPTDPEWEVRMEVRCQEGH